MLVDNPMMQQPSSLFADSSSNNSNNNNSGLTDLEEFLNTELFGPSSSSFTTAMSPGASTSRASSPSDSTSQLLSTPPQAPLENSFPPVQVQMDPYSFLGNVNSNFGFGGGMGLGFGSGAGFDAGTAPPSFFNFLDEEIKADPSMSAFSPFDPPSTGNTGLPYDFLSAFGGPGGTTTPSTSPSSAMAIDPQLVGSPSTHASTTISDEEMDVAQVQEPEPEAVATKKATRSSTKASAASKPTTTTAEEKDDKLTLTIAPVKVGGHGKARKGTVQSGGIIKKVAVPAATSAPIVPLALPIPISASSSSSSSSPINIASSFFPSSSSFPSTLSGNKENNFSSSASWSGTKSEKGDDKDIDDDDDLPADWRPPPEVLAKMTSKEKRQLRNKISARNFRVRRKEYISTLEMDIAERDRLLQAIRSELGSTQSENLALRQEVAALKRALLDGRPTNSASPSAGVAPLSPTSLRSSSMSPTPMLTVRGSDVNLNSAAVTLDDLNLPPPAPLPERSAAEELAARAQAQAAAAQSSALLAPNKHKDLPTSSRLNSNSNAFWGGLSNHHSAFGAGGGYTPVHTVLMPDLNMHTEANLSIGQWVRDVVAAQAASAAAVNPQFSQERELQENMNPVMNQPQGQGQQQQRANNGQGGFDGFVDTNPFTMKTLDAYRMHFWTKMAATASQQASTNSPPSISQQQQQYLAAAQAQAQAQQQQQYAQQRKALERESLSPSPFTLPSHQSGASIHPSGHGITTLNGLASSLKPAYFVNSNKINLPVPSTTMPRLPISNTLSALLAGKHSTSSTFGSAFVGANATTHSHPASSYPSPPSSPNLSGKILSRSGSQQQQMPSPSSSLSKTQQLTPAQMQQAQNAMYAAALASTASQTLLGKLGGAFWDAFSGSSHPGSGTGAGSGSAGSSSSQSHNGAGAKPWDADKVRKVLEGKAVVRVVDVDDLAQMKQMKAETRIPTTATPTSGCGSECSMTAILEESMRSLTLAKK